MAETFLPGSRPRHVTSARGTSYSPERPGEHRDDSATEYPQTHVQTTTESDTGDIVASEASFQSN